MQELLRINSITDFSEEDQTKINDYIPKINLGNKQFIMTYAADEQKNISGYSDMMLELSKDNYLLSLFETMNTLISTVNKFNDEIETRTGLLSFLKIDTSKFLKQYKYTEALVADCENKLKEELRNLMKKNAYFKRLYNNVLENYKKLAMYIVAGEMKIQTGEPENIDLFRDKVMNLRVSSNIANQMATQLMLSQRSVDAAIEKIKSISNHTIPLWKNQVSSLLQSGGQKQDIIKNINRVNNDVTSGIENDIKALRG
ncbi:MAG: toxic anion resistance protein [Clostridiales bacterium]|nr:toxic anion resistance protein [Clostridiales bacterium]